jgi:hypothetical protein
MNGRAFLHVLSVALALSALSFAAGIAGDLSARRADAGVVVRIPPPATASFSAPRAEAAPAPVRVPRRQRQNVVAVGYFPSLSTAEAPLATETPAPVAAAAPIEGPAPAMVKPIKRKATKS